MSGIDLLVQEHEYVSRMLKVIRNACLKFMDDREIDYDDFEKMIKFVREFADGHHHKKEETFLFNRMVEYLGETGKNLITHGMLVEHDLGRTYIRNLDEALNKYKGGQEESKIDIVANAVSYATLLENHINKENNVVFNFAKRALKEDVMKTIDEEFLQYEEKNSFTRQENIDILNYLEKKYN